MFATTFAEFLNGLELEQDGNDSNCENRNWH